MNPFVGFLLPSIHSLPPFYTYVTQGTLLTCTSLNSDFRSLQPNPNTQAIQAQNWTRLILSYARHRRIFTLRVEDCEVAGSEWDEVFRNDRINRMSIHNENTCSKFTVWLLCLRQAPPISPAVLNGKHGFSESCSLRATKANPGSDSVLAPSRGMGRSSS